MENLKERIQKLREELSAINYSATRVTAQMWSEKEWNEVRERSKAITDEIKLLVPTRIAELKAEKATLEEKYPKFSKKLVYAIVGVPKEVSDAERRCKQIDAEIKYLELFI